MTDLVIWGDKNNPAFFEYLLNNRDHLKIQRLLISTFKLYSKDLIKI